MSEQIDINYKAEPTPAKFHAADEFVRGIMGPVGCVSCDTEVLTKKGWVRIDQWDNHKIAVVDITTGVMRFERPEAYHIYEQKWIYHFGGGSKASVSQKITGNHKVPVKYYQKTRIRTAHHLAQSDERYRALMNFKPDQRRKFKEALVRLLVPIRDNGFISPITNEITIQTTSKEQTLRVRGFLDELGVKYKEGVSTDKRDGLRFRFKYIKRLDRLKRWRLHSQEYEWFTDEIQYWDASVPSQNGSYVFRTIDREEADFVQFAAHASGYAAKISKPKDKKHYSVFIRHVKRAVKTGLINGKKVKKVETEDGHVYCFTVSTGFFLMRHDGCVAVTGNSGKSVACCIELVSRAFQQEPAPNGVRYFRAAAIRNSYPELKTTTIKTWQDWFPDSICPINWGAPITGRMVIDAPPTEDFPQGTKLDFEIWFLALDRPKDVKKLLSMELTMAWINEARELPKVILDGVTMRVGRFPSKRHGELTYAGVILDTNPPDDDHWWYNLAEVKCPEDYKFFQQPGALIKTVDESGITAYLPNPDAENVSNQPLGFKYWTQMIHGKSPEWIKSYVLGEYATVYDGKPIYNEYTDSVHCADEDLEVLRGLTLYIGFDFGITPACALFQIAPSGQIRVIDEVVSEDMGVRRFIRDLLKPKLQNEYGGMVYRLWGDPAGSQRAQSTETTCLEILDEEGLHTEPASTQDPVKRREAVAQYLLKYDADGEPGFLLSPRCRFLRKGFNGGFMYERVQVVGEERYKDKPKKNIFSHVHEALQYGILMVSEGMKVERVVARPVRRRSSSGWSA